jgi:hypothetical protein
MFRSPSQGNSNKTGHSLTKWEKLRFCKYQISRPHECRVWAIITPKQSTTQHNLSEKVPSLDIAADMVGNSAKMHPNQT